jgi:predicted membrane protein
MFIKNLAKMLFKSWLVSLALSMILVGLSESFGKTSHPTAGGLLVERVLAETAGLWLFVFLALFLAFVVIKARKGMVAAKGNRVDRVRSEPVFKTKRFGSNLNETMFSMDPYDGFHNPVWPDWYDD